MIDYYGFRKYLMDRYSGRVPGNILSRLTRLEHLMKCDFEKEWEKDELESVKNRFNDNSYICSVLKMDPKSYQKNIYKHSLNRYIDFKTDMS
ncbi:MAG: hypothetical protein IKP61_02415 [Spirochaetales bacterium]|nr:hypothetical protein [Spirochaetales bacterium]